MDDAVIQTRLENLDRRLARVEQILPILATKEDLRSLATREELLLTEEELRREFAELRREIREDGERSRHHMDVLIEAQRGDIQLLAEHLSVVMSRLTDQ